MNGCTQARKSGILRSISIALAALAAATVASAQTTAQSAAATPADVRAVGVSMLHLNVVNLDQSLALYHDVLGMELIAPATPARPNAGLVSEPGSMIRTVQLRTPNKAFQMELVEWSGIALTPVQPRIQDPGEIMLGFNVRDMDAKLAAAKKLGLRVLSKNGEPFLSDGRGGPNKAIMLRDPSGFVVELTDIAYNPTTNASAGPGPITSVAVWVSVQDLAQTVNFYNKAFGFAMAAPPEAGPAPDRIKGLFGDPSITTVRMTRTSFPNSDFMINFQEFRGPDRKPARHRVQDPGGPILLVQVNDFPTAIDRIKANGGIIGQGDTSETLAPDARASWVRDPNGLLIRLSPPAAPPPAAPGGTAAGRSQ